MTLSSHLVLFDFIVYMSRRVIICNPFIGCYSEENRFPSESGSSHDFEIISFPLLPLGHSFGIYIYIRISVKMSTAESSVQNKIALN